MIENSEKIYTILFEFFTSLDVTASWWRLKRFYGALVPYNCVSTEFYLAIDKH